MCTQKEVIKQIRFVSTRPCDVRVNQDYTVQLKSFNMFDFYCASHTRHCIPLLASSRRICFRFSQIVLRKNYWYNFHENGWQGIAWATAEHITIWRGYESQGKNINDFFIQFVIFGRCVGLQKLSYFQVFHLSLQSLILVAASACLQLLYLGF